MLSSSVDSLSVGGLYLGNIHIGNKMITTSVSMSHIFSGLLIQLPSMLVDYLTTYNFRKDIASGNFNLFSVGNQLTITISLSSMDPQGGRFS